MNFKSLLFFGFMVVLIVISGCEQPKSDNEDNQTKNTSDIERQNRGRTGVPVEALVLKNAIVEQNIPLTGFLQPLHSVDIVAEVSGKIVKINKELGEVVTTKHVLALIDDKIPLSNFRETESRVLSTQTNLKIAQLNLKSDEELLKNGDISELAYETSLLTVKTAEADYRAALASLSRMEKTYNDTRIRSPINGLVSRKYIDIGMMVNPNVHLYRVVDLSRLKVEVGIAQSIVSHVRLGSKAVVRISGIVDRSFTGSVIYLSPQADENSGTFNAEIQIENTPDVLLKAGMTAKIDLTLTAMGEQLVVPDHALVTRNGIEYIYKVSSNIARLSQIKTEQVFGSLLLVKEGVTEGDTIVVVGMDNLGTETRVWLEMIH